MWWRLLRFDVDYAGSRRDVELDGLVGHVVGLLEARFFDDGPKGVGDGATRRPNSSVGVKIVFVVCFRGTPSFFSLLGQYIKNQNFLIVRLVVL